MSETVLVTGGSGYIGGWCVIALLQRGYRVRTTVRDLSREAGVRAVIASVVDPEDRLSFHAADLLRDEGWDAAAEGCDYVLHVASPLGFEEPKDADALITPAREGARRAVRAAIKAGVRRVVMTSSVAAVAGQTEAGDRTYDETDWTDLTAAKVSAYAQSKTLAEQAAWDFIAEAGGATSLATVNPSVVLGPALGADFSQSLLVVQRLVKGNVPGVPRLGLSFVDVRDVADLHLRAMIDPKAAGERFIAAGHYAWLHDVAMILREGLGEAGRKAPTRIVPDWMVRLVGLFDREVGFVVPSLGRRRDFSSAKAQSLLGWSPLPLNETVLECARSLLAIGAV